MDSKVYEKTNIHETAFVADGARIVGDVSVGSECGIWYNAVLRGDETSIVIGDRSNVQDNATVHGSPGFPVSVGDGVTIGHGAIVHGCSIGDNSLIGMGAIVLNGAKIGKDCIIGAGALVTQGKEIPDGSLVVGSPGRIKRSLTPEEIQGNTKNCDVYLELMHMELARRS